MSRRPHKKSRNGCAQCKRRRVKCDVAKPTCSNCARRQEKCEYGEVIVQQFFDADGQLSSIPWPNPSPSSQPASSPPIPAALKGMLDSPSPPSIVTVVDPELYRAELLNQWNTHTAATVALDGTSPTKAMLWQTVVPMLAMNNEFLMHQLLSISACHLSVVHPDPARRAEYLQIGRNHNTYAAQLFRALPSMPESPDETGAGVGASMGSQQPHSLVVSRAVYSVVSVVTSLFFIEPMDDPNIDLGAFIDWLIYLRYTLQLGWLHYSQHPEINTPENPVAGFISHLRDGPPALMDPDPGLLTSLEALERENRVCPDTSPVDREHITMAIDSTKLWGRLVPLRPRSHLYCLTWVMTMTNDYFRLLKAKQPAALLVLCHFLVPLMNAPQKWYFRDWFDRVVLSVAAVVEEHWRDEMGWVMEHVDGLQGLGGMDVD